MDGQPPTGTETAHERGPQPERVTPEGLRGAKALAEALLRAQADALLLTAAGGAGGMAIAWQTASTFLGAAAHPAARGLLLLGGVAAGAAALGTEAVRDRAHLWERNGWSPEVAHTVAALDDARRSKRQQRAATGVAPPLMTPR